MTQSIINIGSAANDGTGDPLRTAFTKSNNNFTELYAANYQPLDAELTAIAGLTSAANQVPYFTGSGTAALTPFTGDAWTAWTPTITAQAGTITSTTLARARYTRLGKTINAYFDFTITNAGTGVNFLHISLPVTAAASGGGMIWGRENAVTGIMFSGRILPNATVGSCVRYDGATIITTNYQLQGIMIYEGV